MRIGGIETSWSWLWSFNFLWLRHRFLYRFQSRKEAHGSRRDELACTPEDCDEAAMNPLNWKTEKNGKTGW
jgi:hypothetical protein